MLARGRAPAPGGSLLHEYDDDEPCHMLQRGVLPLLCALISISKALFTATVPIMQ
jgi:hypothetical protein